MNMKTLSLNLRVRRSLHVAAGIIVDSAVSFMHSTGRMLHSGDIT